MSQTALVTGGAGFLGSHVVPALLASGWRVRVLDDLSTGTIENLPDSPSRLEFLRASIEDAEAIAAASDGCSALVHLAAVASVVRAENEPDRVKNINETAAATAFEIAAAKGMRIVFASSAAVYGNSNPQGEEDGPKEPISEYGLQKLACERTLQQISSKAGTSAVALRIFNAYGPNQSHDDPYSGVVSTFARAALRHQPLVIHGDGTQTRDLIFGPDVAQAVLAALAWDRGFLVANIATGNPISIHDLAINLNAVTQNPAGISYGPSRTADVRTSLGSPKRAHLLLGWQATTRLEQGLQTTLQWLRTRLGVN